MAELRADHPIHGGGRRQPKTEQKILDAIADGSLTFAAICHVVGPCTAHSRRGVEIERALHRLRKDGKVRQSGSYPYGGWELVP
jgi:hypothetical protein